MKKSKLIRNLAITSLSILVVVIVYSFLKDDQHSDSYVYLDTDHSQNFFLTNVNQTVDIAGADIPLPTVSIAKIKPNYYAIATYASIILLNRQNKEYCMVDMGAEQQLPTGLYSYGDGTLFVANYGRNNVLYGDINTESCKYNISKVYQTKSLISPENVYSNGKILVSANYDGSNITAIDIDSGQELWSTKVGRAHGVTIVGDKVYATGLLEGKIFEIDINNGKILRKYGSKGSDTNKGQFLWPTSIYPIDNENLIISDAQTGHISLLNIKNLSVSQYTGGNGPTFKFFNYPYAAVPIDDELFVLSAFKGNIIVMDHNKSQVKESWHFGKPKWTYDLAVDESKYPMIQRWSKYTDTESKKDPLRIGSNYYYLSYATLLPSGKNWITLNITKTSPPKLLLSESVTSFIDEYMYFLQNINLENQWDLLISSSTESAIAISQSLPNETTIILPYSLKCLDVWVNENELVGPYGVLDKQQIVKKLNKSKEKILSLHNSIGYIPFLELIQILSQTSPMPIKDTDSVTEQAVEKLNRSFATDAGQKFCHQYKQCNKLNCDKKYIQNLAALYYKVPYSNRYIPLTEWLLVAMIANIPIPV
ncbi:MAG: hypothetical protein AB8B66_00275 [Rickettsiaceae bacterium]